MVSFIILSSFIILGYPVLRFVTQQLTVSDYRDQNSLRKSKITSKLHLVILDKTMDEISSDSPSKVAW